MIDTDIGLRNLDVVMGLENRIVYDLVAGPYLGLAPAAGARSKILRTGPQIAYARRRSIYVAPYAGRFVKYSRGILYDG